MPKPQLSKFVADAASVDSAFNPLISYQFSHGRLTYPQIHPQMGGRFRGTLGPSKLAGPMARRGIFDFILRGRQRSGHFN